MRTQLLGMAPFTIMHISIPEEPDNIRAENSQPWNLSSSSRGFLPLIQILSISQKEQEIIDQDQPFALSSEYS